MVTESTTIPPAFAPDDNMRAALDALAAEPGLGWLPRAASRSGLSMWLVSRRVDTLTHSFKLANVHNNMHFFLHTLIGNHSAACPCSSRSSRFLRAASTINAHIPLALHLLFPDRKMLAAAQHAPLFALAIAHLLLLQFAQVFAPRNLMLQRRRRECMAVAEQWHAQGKRLVVRIRTAAHRCNRCNR